MAHDVFVSYAHQDRTVANAVCATLEAHGIRCWIAPRDILPGSDWGAAIIDAIQETKALVLIFSSNSNDSDQIKREIERTVHQGIAVIPFRIEDVLPNKTLEYFISTQHWLDALTPPLEDHMAHLAETIAVLLEKKISKDKPLPAGGEAPAPSQSPSQPEVKAREERPSTILASAPPRQIPWIPLVAVVGLLLVLVVAGGVWWRWSQPVVATKEVPASLPPTVEPTAKLSADDYYNLGNEAKDTDDKIKYYTKAIEINPYNAQFYYYRGRAYNNKNLFPLAIEDFGKAIQYQANYPSAYASRGFSYYEMGQQDAAIADYTKSISLDPNYAVTFFKRGVSFQKKGDNAKALEDYTEAIRLRPGYVSALNNRGNIYIRKGEYEKALADLNEAVRLNPKYVYGYKSRAFLYERMGDKDRAAADRAKVKELDPKGLVRGF
ncbi:MAG: toll/interleukin-1 receptor domain-containing protein [Proteobacteria bacterium]|nr:toll/interleukin-1 receptor domain-containing protein [Pseudomonadota bacterium]